MFKNLLENIDARLLREAGGILVALFAMFVLYKVLTNDLSHIADALDRQSLVVSHLDTSVQLNTEVLKIIQQRMK